MSIFITENEHIEKWQVSWKRQYDNKGSVVMTLPPFHNNKGKISTQENIDGYECVK